MIFNKKWPFLMSCHLLYLQSTLVFFNDGFLRKRGMASNPKMEFQVFLCVFQKDSAIATLGVKKMGKFLWEGMEKCLP